MSKWWTQQVLPGYLLMPLYLREINTYYCLQGHTKIKLLTEMWERFSCLHSKYDKHSWNVHLKTPLSMSNKWRQWLLHGSLLWLYHCKVSWQCLSASMQWNLSLSSNNRSLFKHACKMFSNIVRYIQIERERERKCWKLLMTEHGTMSYIFSIYWNLNSVCWKECIWV
jgi:hypothetical protein